MEFLKTDLIGLIQFLLPGFIASWIFHSLTAHPKTTPFERVVQALIFTGISQWLVYVLEIVLTTIGKNDRDLQMGIWTSQIAYIWSIAISLGLGISFAWSANLDWLHAILRTLRVTKRTSYPSEWFSAFNKIARGSRSDFVVLHLKGEKPRRLFGRVDEWPDHPDVGHFVIYEASWLADMTQAPESGGLVRQETSLATVDCVLIAATDVEIVEIMKKPNVQLAR